MPVSRAALTILAATILANEAPCELLVSGERQHLGPSGNAEHKPQSVRIKTRVPRGTYIRLYGTAVRGLTDIEHTDFNT